MNTIARGNTLTIDSEAIPQLVTIPVQDAKAGQVYRIYYGFSSAGHPLFASGWGDIGICTTNGNNQVNRCF